MFVLGAVLIFSLALGELVEPAFGSPVTMAGLLPPTLLTTLFLALAVLHLKKLSFRPSTHSPTQPGLLSQSSVLTRGDGDPRPYTSGQAVQLTSWCRE